jgi:hypothetical protein
MIASEEFYTIPDFASRKDPRVSGNPYNFAAHSNIGPNAQQWAWLQPQRTAIGMAPIPRSQLLSSSRHHASNTGFLLVLKEPSIEVRRSGQTILLSFESQGQTHPYFII